jgi:hypothetical protein
VQKQRLYEEVFPDEAISKCSIARERDCFARARNDENLISLLEPCARAREGLAK